MSAAPSARPPTVTRDAHRDAALIDRLMRDLSIARGVPLRVIYVQYGYLPEGERK